MPLIWTLYKMISMANFMDILPHFFSFFWPLCSMWGSQARGQSALARVQTQAAGACTCCNAWSVTHCARQEVEPASQHYTGSSRSPCAAVATSATIFSKVKTNKQTNPRRLKGDQACPAGFPEITWDWQTLQLTPGPTLAWLYDLGYLNLSS